MHSTAGIIATFTAVVGLTGCRMESTGPTQRESRTIELDKAEQTRVELRMSVGELKIDGGSSHLAEGAFTYNVASWKPRMEYHSTGTRGDLEITQSEGNSASGDTKNEWNIRLNDKMPFDISAHFGVGAAQMNLGSLDLRNVDLKMGVGEVKMDLRGNPRHSYDVRIQGGVGEATVYLPKNVGIVANASGGIGEIRTDGLTERNGRWINAAQERSPIQIHVDVKGGVGQINLIAE